MHATSELAKLLLVEHDYDAPRNNKDRRGNYTTDYNKQIILQTMVIGDMELLVELVDAKYYFEDEEKDETK